MALHCASSSKGVSYFLGRRSYIATNNSLKITREATGRAGTNTPIPDNLMSHSLHHYLQGKKKKKEQIQHHSIGNSLFVAQRHLINSESAHLLGKKSQISSTPGQRALRSRD